MPVLALPFLSLFGLKTKKMGGDGTSVKVFAHMASWFNSSSTRKFDYGKEENLKRYGSELPTEYDFSNISTKTSIITGS